MTAFSLRAMLAGAVLLWMPVAADATVMRPEGVITATTSPLVTEIQFRRGGHGFRGGRHGSYRPGGHRPGGHRPGGHRPGHGGWHGGHWQGGHHRPRRSAAIGAGIAGLAAGAAIGGALAQPRYAYPVAVGDPAAFCAQRFGSYDPVSRTYLGYDGLRHACP